MKFQIFKTVLLLSWQIWGTVPASLFICRTKCYLEVCIKVFQDFEQVVFLRYYGNILIMHNRGLCQTQVTNRRWVLQSYCGSKVQTSCITCLDMCGSVHGCLTLRMLTMAQMRCTRSGSQKFIQTQSPTCSWGRPRPEPIGDLDWACMYPYWFHSQIPLPGGSWASERAFTACQHDKASATVLHVRSAWCTAISAHSPGTH